MRTVYLVSSGDYSDYDVHCAFEVEADAEAYIAALDRAAYDQAIAWHGSDSCNYYGYDGHTQGRIAKHSFNEWRVCHAFSDSPQFYTEHRQLWAADEVPVLVEVDVP